LPDRVERLILLWTSPEDTWSGINRGGFMGKDRKHSLHTFIHRTLILRLIIAGLLISLIIGVSVLLYERGRVSQEAIEYGVSRMKLFTTQYGHLFENPEHFDGNAIRQAVTEFRQSRQKLEEGDFVYVGLFNSGGSLITELFQEGYEYGEKVKEIAKERDHRIPEESDQKHEVLRISGTPHLRIVLPIKNNQGQSTAFTDALFAFSSETIRSFRLRGLRAMMGVMIVVLLTTAFLYPIILRLTRRISDFSVMLLNANLETLETLGSAIAQRDSDTNAHNYRVSIYAARIGEEIDLPTQTMRSLIKGSFLHDVGKIAIPDKILHKPGKLNSEEFEIMKTHVNHGREIVERSTWLHDTLEVVFSHHEKMEGKGYPQGLASEEIPITARIFAIADVFDALTSKRPYKDPLSYEKTMEIMEETKGTHFDSRLLDVFIRISRPLYDRYGGKEAMPRDELEEIIRKYFTDGMDSLEY
jgi:HD-GYP domain-containing protein (c-di-GMP phosphodiesterase class II)